MAYLFQEGGKVEGRDATPTKFFSFDSYNMKSISNVMMLVKLFTYATVVVPNEKIHGVCNSI